MPPRPRDEFVQSGKARSAGRCEINVFSFQRKVGQKIIILHYVRLHFSEQYFTLSHTLAHFLRHVNGRPQVTQVLLGRSDFLRIFIGVSLIDWTLLWGARVWWLVCGWHVFLALLQPHL